MILVPARLLAARRHTRVVLDPRELLKEKGFESQSPRGVMTFKDPSVLEDRKGVSWMPGAP